MFKVAAALGALGSLVALSDAATVGNAKCAECDVLYLSMVSLGEQTSHTEADSAMAHDYCSFLPDDEAAACHKGIESGDVDSLKSLVDAHHKSVCSNMQICKLRGPEAASIADHLLDGDAEDVLAEDDAEDDAEEEADDAYYVKDGIVRYRPHDLDVLQPRTSATTTSLSGINPVTGQVTAMTANNVIDPTDPTSIAHASARATVPFTPAGQRLVKHLGAFYARKPTSWTSLGYAHKRLNRYNVLGRAASKSAAWWRKYRKSYRRRHGYRYSMRPRHTRLSVRRRHRRRSNRSLRNGLRTVQRLKRAAAKYLKLAHDASKRSDRMLMRLRRATFENAQRAARRAHMRFLSNLSKAHMRHLKKLQQRRITSDGPMIADPYKIPGHEPPKVIPARLPTTPTCNRRVFADCMTPQGDTPLPLHRGGGSIASAQSWMTNPALQQANDVAHMPIGDFPADPDANATYPTRAIEDAALERKQLDAGTPDLRVSDPLALADMYAPKGAKVEGDPGRATTPATLHSQVQETLFGGPPTNLDQTVAVSPPHMRHPADQANVDVVQNYGKHPDPGQLLGLVHTPATVAVKPIIMMAPGGPGSLANPYAGRPVAPMTQHGNITHSSPAPALNPGLASADPYAKPLAGSKFSSE